MGLSIKTEEADRLVRLRAEQAAKGDYTERMQAFVNKHAHLFDRRPITKPEWDEACGDTPEQLGFPKW
ncbi:type II toxin-antitoxin system VapB family antitoxin [Glycocaulis sp.]|uniref:type II toxin-antitoxin system VapB family antitoxin n=1 Tax=Glycocaulis sp. TaxID=1969725 RepID=UPI003F70D5EC